MSEMVVLLLFYKTDFEKENGNAASSCGFQEGLTEYPSLLHPNSSEEPVGGDCCSKGVSVHSAGYNG
jgi:hypothetical protein